MREIALIALLFHPCLAFTQEGFNNLTHTALQAVISDFPHDFKNIKTDLISENPQSSDFGCTVQVPGALQTIITRYTPDADKEIYSWKSVLSESEDFEVAARKYKELFTQIRNSIIKIEGEKPFILTGNYEAPSEQKKFSSTSFYLLPPAGAMKKLKVELLLENYIVEWKVSLLVYEQQEESMVME